MVEIVFVIPALDQSGAERQLALLAAGLPGDRFRVHLIALAHGGHFADELTAQGIPVHIAGKRFRFDLTIAWRLRKLLRRLQPDIVQSWLFAANTLVRLPGVVSAGTRVIVSERCVDTWKSPWQLRVDRWLASRADAMTANSASVAEFYQQLSVPQDRLHVIPNGIPAPPATRSVGRLRKEFGLSDRLRLIGCVGRLAEQKCVMDVIWGFQLLHQLVDDVHLVIIGDGPERAKLEQFSRNMGCDDRITFTGHRPDAYELMQDLDVYCLASSFEGMSNSLMEAMSLGIPVVVSDISSNRELVQDTVTGLTYPAGSSPALAKAVRRMLQDDPLRQAAGRAAAALMRERYGVDDMIRRHIALYDQLRPDRIAGVTSGNNEG